MIAEILNEQLVQIQQHQVIDLLGNRRTLAQALEVARGAGVWADHLISRFEAEADLPRPIACVPGCTYCCFNQVEVTPLEALLIWDAVARHLSAADQTALRGRLDRAVAATAGRSKTEIARRRQDLPCPLLSGDLCTVYPVRPLVCRAMHSLDAGRCEASARSTRLMPDEYYLHRYEIIYSLTKGLTDGCRALGCQAEVLDLSRALKLLAGNLDLADRWLLGEAAFEGPDG